MTARHGAHHGSEPVMSTQAFERVMANPLVRDRLWSVGRRENDDFDLPYLAGYSEDGDTIYFDRHLPETCSFERDGRKIEFDPRDYVRLHERLEKTLIDELGWTYWPAHGAANAYERRGVLQGLGAGTWAPYEKSLMPFIKGDAREKLVKVPPDLDMTPYYAEPVDKSLVLRMEAAQGRPKKPFSKDEVDYADGHRDAHCGPTRAWPSGSCAHYSGTNACELVRGYIRPGAWCKKWEAA